MIVPLLGLGPTEITLIVVLFILLFGAAAIPKLARGVGRAQGEFQKAKADMEREMAAGRNEAAAEPGADEAQVRKTARDLGIEEADLDLDAVKKAINEKLA